MAKPYLEKSNQSMLAAEKLKTEHFFASTVNRAYYSCMQYIFHVLTEKLTHTPDEITQTNAGTHVQAQKLLSNSLYQICKDDKDKYIDYKWFQSKLPELKLARVKADYNNDVITSDEGHDAIRKANDLISVLKKHYRNK
jgi:uncharacterized protein (UPF0332 family)